MRREFINADCMDPEVGIPSYPDNYFDLAIVDPPYFSGPEKRIFYGQRISDIGVNRYYKPSLNWEKVDLTYLDHLLHVANKYIFWGCNYYPEFTFHTGRIVWDKCNESSDYSDCEIAATNLFDHTRVVRFMWNGMLQGSLSDGTRMEGNKRLNEKRIHPTQKPVQLYRLTIDRVRKYLPENPKILDTHTGSASSLIAYEHEGFDYVAFELDPNYYKSAKKRMDQVLSQTRIDFLT